MGVEAEMKVPLSQHETARLAQRKWHFDIVKVPLSLYGYVTLWQ